MTPEVAEIWAGAIKSVASSIGFAWLLVTVARGFFGDGRKPNENS